MNKDIRIIVGLADHPKTIKLVRKCGEEGFRCLIRLWCYAAEYRPTGVLSNMDVVDISIASGWVGNENDWVDALQAVGFIEVAEGELVLHDWQAHNPYAFHAEDRSAKARAAAAARYAKLNAAKSNDVSELRKTGDVLDAAGSNAASKIKQCPLPPPSPKKDSEPNGSGAEAPVEPSPDLKAVVFGQGLDWLAKQSGKPKDKLRSLLGKACRDCGEAVVIEILARAQREGPIDPISWLEAKFQARASPKTAKKSMSLAFDDLEKRLRA